MYTMAGLVVANHSFLDAIVESVLGHDWSRLKTEWEILVVSLYDMYAPLTEALACAIQSSIMDMCCTRNGIWMYACKTSKAVYGVEKIRKE